MGKKKTKNSWYNHEICDLRTKCGGETNDCHACLAHPAVVIAVFVIGICLFMWGIWNMTSYLMGWNTSLVQLWWQTTVVFFFITIMGVLIPYRFRFGMTLYGIITGLLLTQYVVFFLAFPMKTPSKEEMENVMLFNQYIKQKKELLKKQTVVSSNSS